MDDKHEKQDKEGMSQFDKLVEDFRTIMENSDDSLSVVNLERMREMYRCYGMLKTVFQGQKVKIDFCPHDGSASIGKIEILVNKSLKIRNTKLFHDAVKFASNYEIYPRTDGKIAFNLMFYGLTDFIS